MKIFAILLPAILFIAAPASTWAKDCSLGIFKTYTARQPGKKVCDDKGLPAEFAGDLGALSAGLAERGYTAKKYDQCKNGSDDPSAYSLISQLGDCVQEQAAISCKLYVAIYENASNKVVFENTVEGTGLGSVKLQLSRALELVPTCEDLR